MSKSEYEEIFLWHENIRDYSSSETIFTLHKHLLWKLIYINQARNSNKRNWVINVSCDHFSPHYYHLWPGVTETWSLVSDWILVTRCAPSWSPHQGPLSSPSHDAWDLVSVNFDKFALWQVHHAYERLIVYLPVSLFHFVRQIQPQIIPAVTVQLLRTAPNTSLQSFPEICGLIF